jgi:aldehyde dehydrogenase (NAD+)
MPTSLRTVEGLYIAGSWTTKGRATVDVLNPANEEVIAQIGLADVEDANAAVDAAARLHAVGGWSNRTHDQRAEVLDQIADGIERRQADFARIYIEDQGGLASFAPLVVGEAVRVFRRNAELARTLSDRPVPRLGSGSQLLVHHVPVGPVLASVSWNGPLILAAVKIAAALAAGCPVIVKVDVHTPLTAFLLAEVFDELDLPAGLISFLPARRDVAGHLVAHPSIKHVSFTGSTEVGKQVMKSAADNMTRVTLELGGKSAGILLDDFDPSSAGMLYPGCLAQSGQVCTTFSRLLVPAQRLREWEEALAQTFSSLPIGDPADAATMIGPLVSRQQLETTERYVAIAREEGRIVTGGKRPAHFSRGFWYEPTLVTDVGPKDRIVREEVFGPVIVLMPYRDIEDAVRLANDSDYGLAAGVFTSNVERALEIAPRLAAGAVSINNFGANFLEPFGGFGASGIGREGGKEGIEEFLESMQIQLPALPSP